MTFIEPLEHFIVLINKMFCIKYKMFGILFPSKITTVLPFLNIPLQNDERVRDYCSLTYILPPSVSTVFL